MPELAEGLLFGRLWLTVDRIMELPYKTPECLAPEDIALKFTDWFARRMELIQAGIVSVRLAISASGS